MTDSTVKIKAEQRGPTFSHQSLGQPVLLAHYRTTPMGRLASRTARSAVVPSTWEIPAR
jgi:hypothetical protein